MPAFEVNYATPRPGFVTPITNLKYAHLQPESIMHESGSEYTNYWKEHQDLLIAIPLNSENLVSTICISRLFT